MSGHSKWASIKHKKAATDAKRGQLFTKLARAIAIAAREGGGDPESNFTLAAAVEKAKGYSMPKDNIERAIARGTGEGSGDEQIERVAYEGYGPGGAAEPGSVAWQFDKKGVIIVDGDRYSEDDLIGAIDAGAEDVAPDGDVLKVTTDPAALAAVRGALEGDGIDVESAELAMEPNTVVEIAQESEARALVRLMESLDDHDDVEAVHANFDIPESLLEQVAA